MQKLKKFADNKKGFTLIEVFVVVAMMVALTTLGGSGFVALSHARASKVANSLDVLMSQSKVNALSGRDNILTVFYNETEDTDKGYKAKTYYGILEDTDGIYEVAELGNRLVTINFKNTKGTKNVTAKDNIKIVFDQKTGAVNECRMIDASNNSILVDTDNKTEFYIQSGSTYMIELFKITGEHRVQG